jgi:hypothetical protein
MKNAAALLLALSAAGAALAQQNPQAPTPIPQSVVVPSLPDEKNKEGIVRPGATQQTDAGGWVQTNMGQIDPNAPKTAAPAAGAAPPPAGAPAGPGIGAPARPLPPESGPTGKAIVDAANVTVRGIVKAYEKGVSITVTEANGKDRTVLLADKAAVYDGVAVGDKVVVRVPLQKPADGKHADRVEKQKASKTPLPSKFSQAQSPKS